MTLPLPAAAFCGCLLAVSCGVGKSGGEKPSVSECWESSEDCMNGYTLVTDSTGLMGLVAGENSQMSIRPLYHELFFLTDDLLAGYEGGKWSFLDTKGQTLAQVDGKGSEDADELLEQYCRQRAVQLDAWEEIVRGYERLCSVGASENVSSKEMNALSDSLLREVHAAEGVMGEGQRRRIEDAFELYRERRGI